MNLVSGFKGNVVSSVSIFRASFKILMVTVFTEALRIISSSRLVELLLYVKNMLPCE